MQTQTIKAMPLKRRDIKPGYLLLLLLICILTSSFCFFLYWHDNKYTAPGPDASYGNMELDDAVLEKQGLVWMTDGWEFYGGKLLKPAYFLSGGQRPDRYVFVGQFGGFENVDGQPYGSASYRITVKLPDKTNVYALYLPEIFHPAVFI